MSQHIVVIEDEPMCLYFIEMALTKSGYIVEGFDNARGALQYIISSGRAIDLILSDIAMPIMTGLDLLQTLKSNSLLKSIPVILQTADPYAEAECMTSGASGFIAKPYRREELLHLVHRVLNHGTLSPKKAQNVQGRYAAITSFFIALLPVFERTAIAIP